MTVDNQTPSNVTDVLKPLRDSWIALILERNLHKEFFVTWSSIALILRSRKNALRFREAGW